MLSLSIHIEDSRIETCKEPAMVDSVDALVLDLLEFVSREDRPYSEVMDAWRTSCPRLPVWEEANERGFVARAYENGRATVRITQRGREFLKSASRAH
jgi:hypothetical protein